MAKPRLFQLSGVFLLVVFVLLDAVGALKPPVSRSPTGQLVRRAACDSGLADDDPTHADSDDTTDEELSSTSGLVGRRNLPSFNEDTVVPGCPNLSVSPPNYRNTTVTGRYYFLNPNNPDNVAITRLNPGTVVANTTWAREHIYEIQLLTNFMGDVIAKDFNCTWLRTNVFINQWPRLNQTLKDALAATEPTGTAPMPELFSHANYAKQAFLSSAKRKFRQAATLNNTATSNVIYLIRSAALSVEYLNEAAVKSEFLRIAGNVENLWVTFFGDINGQYDVRTKYRTWLKSVLTGYGTSVQQFYADANAALRGITNVTMINVPRDCSNTSVRFTPQDLMFLNGQLPKALNWTYP